MTIKFARVDIIGNLIKLVLIKCWVFKSDHGGLCMEWEKIQAVEISSIDSSSSTLVWEGKGKDEVIVEGDSLSGYFGVGQIGVYLVSGLPPLEKNVETWWSQSWWRQVQIPWS